MSDTMTSTIRHSCNTLGRSEVEEWWTYHDDPELDRLSVYWDNSDPIHLHLGIDVCNGGFTITTEDAPGAVNHLRQEAEMCAAFLSEGAPVVSVQEVSAFADLIEAALDWVAARGD